MLIFTTTLSRVALDTFGGVFENIEAGTDIRRIVTDAAVDACTGVGIIAGLL